MSESSGDVLSLVTNGVLLGPIGSETSGHKITNMTGGVLTGIYETAPIKNAVLAQGDLLGTSLTNANLLAPVLESKNLLQYELSSEIGQ